MKGNIYQISLCKRANKTPPNPTFRNGSYFIENITDPRLATNITFENFVSDLVKGLENKKFQIEQLYDLKWDQNGTDKFQKLKRKDSENSNSKTVIFGGF